MLNNKQPNWAAIVFATLAALWLLFCLSGCSYRWASKYMDNHGFKGAAYCETRYPVDSFFIQGEAILDTTIKYEDSLIFLLPRLKSIPFSYPSSIKIPSKKVVTVTKIKVDTVGLISNSHLANLRAKIAELTDNGIILQEKNNRLKMANKRLKDGRNTWRWIGCSSIAVILAFGAGFFIRKFKIL